MDEEEINVNRSLVIVEMAEKKKWEIGWKIVKVKLMVRWMIVNEELGNEGMRVWMMMKVLEGIGEWTMIGYEVVSLQNIPCGLGEAIVGRRCRWHWMLCQS